jgi:TolB-like protein/Tfp pilus assembly protein PilF
VIIEGDDIFGDGINVAARLEGLAPPGGVCISDVVRQMIRGRLDLAFEDLGEQRVKNMARPVRVWQWTEDAGAAAPRASGVEKAAPVPSADKPSLAVLPFDNLSRDPDQEYFSDGLTEDLITDLSQLSGLSVTARHAVFQYKGRPARPQDVARNLGVRYVLEGSARRAGKRVRVNAQLIDAATGFHLWAERYDRDVSDIFDLQDELTHTIVAALKIKLTARDRNIIARRYTDNIEAYDLYLKAYEAYRRKTKERTERARDLFRRASELDPSFAAAYAGLSHTYFVEWNSGWTTDPAVLDRAVKLGERAVATNEMLPEAHDSLALLYAYQGRWDESVVEAKRAVSLDPGYAKGYARLAEVLTLTGRPDEAWALLETAMNLEPYHWSRFYQWVLGSANFATSRYPEAIAALKRCLEDDPDFLPAHIHLAAIYGELEMADEAKAELAEMAGLSDGLSLSSFERQLFPYRDPEVLRRLVEGLRKAGLPE